MTPLPARGVALLSAGATLTMLLGATLVTAPPAAADLSTSCTENDDSQPSAKAGATLKELRIGDAQQWLASNGKSTAGTGVVVAVVDSGVSTAAPIAQAGPQVNRATRAGASYYHGTAVAGIIAGGPDSDGSPIGIAPAASILDVKVYDADVKEEDTDTEVSSATVSTGLADVLAAKQAGMNIKVANLSLSVSDTPDLKILVNKLWKAGVVVVASSGNRTFAEDDPLADAFSTYHAGENAAESIYPAGYERAVAVATTADGIPDADPLSYILQSTAIDVAVPTSGAPSYSLAGTSCLLRTPATSWAAAEVSGVLAMLASTFPDDKPAQLVSRLVNTANGRDDVRNPLTGAGVVQPYEALSRPMSIAADGAYDQTTPVQDQQQAELPPARTDPLGSTRGDMIWFGVVGGGILVLALVLRPVLARRRMS